MGASLTVAKQAERLVERIHGIAERHAAAGGGVTYLARDDALAEVIALRERPRPVEEAVAGDGEEMGLVDPR